MCKESSLHYNYSRYMQTIHLTKIRSSDYGFPHICLKLVKLVILLFVVDINKRNAALIDSNVN